MSSLIAVPGLSRAMAVRGLSQLELSQRAGVSRGTVATALRGSPLTPRTYRRLVDALELVAVSATARELGAIEVGEAPAQASDTGS